MKLKRKLNKEKTKLIFYGKCDSQTWKEAQIKAKKEILKNTVIPGFRKGKAPIMQVNKNFSLIEFLEKTAEQFLEKFVELTEENASKEKFNLHEPFYSIETLTEDKLEFLVIYEILPKIDLKGYKNTGIKFIRPKVTKKEVQKKVKEFLDEYKTEISTNGPIKLGDVVTLDFKGSIFIKGKNIKEKTSLKNYKIKIGSNDFDVLEKILIGKTKGFKQKIELNIDENFQKIEKCFNGKSTLHFKVESIKKYKFPELNNDFVKSLKINNVKTIEEFTDYLENLLINEKTKKAKQDFKEKILNNIIKETEIPISDELLSEEIYSLNIVFEHSLEEKNITKKQYLKTKKITEDEFFLQLKEKAIESVKKVIIFSNFFKNENLKVTVEDYEQNLEYLAKTYGVSKKSVIELMPSDGQWGKKILEDKLIDKLIEWNK
ncbi:trigger factor [Candidatus Mycoplasma pogonae]